MARDFNRPESPVVHRRREQTFEHWRAEILRFALDERTLNAVAARALNDSDVRNDPTLAGQIRQYIQQRRAELHKARAPHAGGNHPMTPGQRSGFSALGAVEHDVTLEEAAASLRSLDEHMTEYVSHLFEVEAEAVVARVRALCERYPQLNQTGQVEQFERRLRDLKGRIQDSRTRIDLLEKQAIEAAERGDHDVAANCLKRLSSIHAAHPQMLPDKRLAELRERLTRAGAHEHQRQAARQLVEREKAIARELKQIAAVVHHFHKVSRRQPHDPVEYARAKALYEKALAEVRSHDAQWLAATVLELVDLLADWDAPTDKAQAQVDHFIASVRRSLAHIRHEIRAIEQEQGGRSVTSAPRPRGPTP